MPKLTWIELGIAVVALFVAFGMGFELRVLIDHSNERAQLKKDAKDQHNAQDNADAAGADWETEKAKLLATNKNLQKALDDEKANPVYTHCVVPAGGVRLFNAAVSGSAAR